MPLGERGQFGAVHGGLGLKLRGAQGQPVLVQNVEPSAAGGQHPARAVRSLGSQGLGEPAGGPRERRTTPAGPGRRDQMTVGGGSTAEFQGHPPGQQVRLGRVACAKVIQPGGRPVRLAQERGGHRADFVAGLDEHARRMGPPPGAVL